MALKFENFYILGIIARDKPNIVFTLPVYSLYGSSAPTDNKNIVLLTVSSTFGTNYLVLKCIIKGKI